MDFQIYTGWLLSLLLITFVGDVFQTGKSQSAGTEVNKDGNTTAPAQVKDDASPASQVQAQAKDDASATSADPKLTEHKTEKKPMKNDLFNSFLCGVGYTYDKTSAKCISSHQKKDLPGSAGANSTLATQNGDGIPTGSDSSVEPIPEDLDKIDGMSNGFFPLECGMNYRYLRKAKICKPITAPKTAKEMMEETDSSSSSENWEGSE